MYRKLLTKINSFIVHSKFRLTKKIYTKIYWFIFGLKLVAKGSNLNYLGEIYNIPRLEKKFWIFTYMEFDKDYRARIYDAMNQYCAAANLDDYYGQVYRR